MEKICQQTDNNIFMMLTQFYRVKNCRDILYEILNTDLFSRHSFFEGK